MTSLISKIQYVLGQKIGCTQWNTVYDSLINNEVSHLVRSFQHLCVGIFRAHVFDKKKSELRKGELRKILH